MTTKVMTPTDQVARFRSQLRDSVRYEFEQAGAASAKLAAVCEQLADLDASAGASEADAGEAADALDRATAMRSYAKLMDELVIDSKVAPLIDILASAAESDVTCLERDADTPAGKWIQTRLTSELRAAVLDYHCRTQTSMGEDVHEQVAQSAPPAIELLLQAVWAPMHCRFVG